MHIKCLDIPTIYKWVQIINKKGSLRLWGFLLDIVRDLV